MSAVQAVAFLDDGTAVIARRFAVVSPHIELYQSKRGPIIAFVMREPLRDDEGRLWRVLLAQNITAVGDKQAVSGYEPSASRMFSLSYFSVLCPDKPSVEECLADLINNVVQKRLSERYSISVDGRFIVAVDTSPAQVERMIEALHADVNTMLTAAYAEFQHWLQNVRTFERLAKAVAKRGSGWLVLGVIAIAMLVMLPMLLPQIMETLSRFGLWRP
ncbi:MAG: hypothetical protein ACO2PM_25160 [Pyrobaculum sp.]